MEEGAEMDEISRFSKLLIGSTKTWKSNEVECSMKVRRKRLGKIPSGPRRQQRQRRIRFSLNRSFDQPFPGVCILRNCFRKRSSAISRESSQRNSSTSPGSEGDDGQIVPKR